jgi:hypothetical protein
MDLGEHEIGARKIEKEAPGEHLALLTATTLIDLGAAVRGEITVTAAAVALQVVTESGVEKVLVEAKARTAIVLRLMVDDFETQVKGVGVVAEVVARIKAQGVGPSHPLEVPRAEQ